MTTEEIKEQIALLERLLELHQRLEKFRPAQPETSPVGGCHVCGIDFGGGPFGYVCGNPRCPSQITFSSLATCGTV